MFIYALHDPDSGDIRYVGKTTYADPSRRLKYHLRDSKYYRPSRDRTLVQRWIGGLSSPPVLSVLSANPAEGLNACEIHWIAKLRAGGCLLMNITKGGAGASSRGHDSGRKKGSKNARPYSAEAKANMARSHCRTVCRYGHQLTLHPRKDRKTKYCHECRKRYNREWMQRWTQRQRTAVPLGSI